MTPIDDALRRTLRDRAEVVGPAADPLLGIEARARRMRRNRLAAAGSALALAVTGVAVPLALGGGDSGAVQPDTVAIAPDQVGAALDPAAPWPYRTGPVAPDDAQLAAARNAAQQPGTTWTPLFGQVADGRVEVVFLSTGPAGPGWGFVELVEGVTTRVSGPTPLAEGAPVLLAGLAGGPVERLLVLAAPETSEITYTAGGDPAAVPLVADGVGLQPLAGEVEDDRVRVVARDGTIAYDGAAPGLSDYTPEPLGPEPTNVLGWPGQVSIAEPLLVAAKQAVPHEGLDREAVQLRLLHVAVEDDGTRYLLAQSWLPGEQEAGTLGYVEYGGERVETQQKAPLPADADLAVMVLADGGTERLVVVPRPGTSAVEYSPDGTTWRTVGGAGTATFEREPQGAVPADRVRLRNAGGAIASQDDVFTLLCGATSCG